MTTPMIKEWIGSSDAYSADVMTRFAEKIIPEPNSGCWIWIGAHKGHGYGHMAIASGRREIAHRVSYRAFKGEIPIGHVVCHRCDNRYCVNPEHLWIGTAKQNVQDCIAKGRARRGVVTGERNTSAKLTNEQVREIRSHPWYYGSGVELAEKYGVRQATISAIRNHHARRRG